MNGGPSFKMEPYKVPFHKSWQKYISSREKKTALMDEQTESWCKNTGKTEVKPRRTRTLFRGRVYDIINRQEIPRKFLGMKT